MDYAERLAGLRALIAGSKAAAERAKHDLADSLARIGEAERLIGEIEELQSKGLDHTP
ncbi:hypothetical protein [Sphingomonas sp. S2-65]|uniref:hypothetical protein n=1 Tax=Sphingomonas sp. S2-65 TaxID=2903960 RepID=UPI001F45BC66|nr:hypothetical protein [Sphingomonas sp. S2-65]UYY57789.1 hypothetical protein LZ586_14135 [Sphingomonas sp. S2-65]